VSDQADASLGTIVFERGTSARGTNSHIHDHNDDDGNGNGGGGGGGGQSTDINIVHRPIWALKYIAADQRNDDDTLSRKKWYMIIDDASWVNIPALLSLLHHYNHQCPIAMGAIWSQTNSADASYAAGTAGILLSHASFIKVTSALATPACEYLSTGTDRTISQCLWRQHVQLVHVNGFSFDAPRGLVDHTPSSTSNNNNDMDPLASGLFLPPIAEAITYRVVDTKQMAAMTIYANQRWGYLLDDADTRTNSNGDNDDNSNNTNNDNNDDDNDAASSSASASIPRNTTRTTNNRPTSTSTNSNGGNGRGNTALILAFPSQQQKQRRISSPSLSSHRQSLPAAT
jgi:type II secretory pathway pseudopilin PulG